MNEPHEMLKLPKFAKINIKDLIVSETVGTVTTYHNPSDIAEITRLKTMLGTEKAVNFDLSKLIEQLKEEVVFTDTEIKQNIPSSNDVLWE